MAKFQAGDVVRLNSGGPDMTVKSADPVAFGVAFINGRSTPPTGVRNDLVECEWFVGKKLETKRFVETSLTLVPQPR